MFLLSLLSLVGCKRASDIDEPLPTPAPDRCEWAPAHTWSDNEVPPAILDAFRDERLQLGAEGVAFAILQDGEVRYAGALGMADEDTDRAMLPTTLLRSGSTLKMQTAAAVLAQEAQGTLNLDDPLSAHLPDFDLANSPGLAGLATLHELLSHQGGFYDYTPIDGPSAEAALYNHAHNVFARDYWMMVEAGAFWNYSNPNFALAGLAAQEASGTPYRTLMDESLWSPLCMDRSFFEGAEVEADGDYAMATTYDWETGIGTRRVGPGSYDHAFSAPAGFGWTSPLDMVHFAQFLMEGNEDVMPLALSESLTTGHVDTLDLPDALIQYGYGVFLEPGYVSDGEWRVAPLWKHDGAIPGYSADLVIHPDSGVAIAVLSNSDGAYFRNSIATVLDTLVDPPTAAFPENPFDSATFERYAGSYDDPFNVGPIEITHDAGTLRIDAPDLVGFGVDYGPTLTPIGLHNFAWSIDGQIIVLTFVDGPSGEPRWIRHRAFVAQRAEVSTAAHRPSSQDVERLRKHLERLPPARLPLSDATL